MDKVVAGCIAILVLMPIVWALQFGLGYFLGASVVWLYDEPIVLGGIALPWITGTLALLLGFARGGSHD